MSQRSPSRSVAVLVAIAACSGPQEVVAPPDPAGPSPVESLMYEERWLDSGSWHPENHAALEAWLDRVARTDFEAPPVAIFDWDNTSIFNDVGESVLRHQLDRLALRFTPSALGEFLPEEVNGQQTVAGDVALSDIRADILEAYAQLWPLIQAGDIEGARALPAHRDFRAKAAWLYGALIDTESIGARYTYLWLAGWLAGHRSDEVSILVGDAIEAARELPIGSETWSSASEGRSGALEFTFTSGLCPQAEMRELMGALIRAGVRVYVVTASGELIVEAAAAALEYPVGPEAIYGIRLMMNDGVCTTRPVSSETFPVTYRQGKVDVIRREIGTEPIFVAGDSDTDFEMLTAFETTEVRLVINRNKHDADIGQLYRDALASSSSSPGAEGPITLLQGRDEGRCMFQPSRETTAVGASTPEEIPR